MAEELDQETLGEQEPLISDRSARYAEGLPRPALTVRMGDGVVDPRDRPIPFGVSRGEDVNMVRARVSICCQTRPTSTACSSGSPKVSSA